METMIKVKRHSDLPVVVHDGVDPVRDRQHRAVGKLRPYRRLDQSVGLGVDGRRRLVEH